VLLDPVVLAHLNLQPLEFPHWQNVQRDFPAKETLYKKLQGPCSFPEHTIGITFYISFEVYQAIDKPEGTRAFFVVRDPRDILISFYQRLPSFPMHLQSILTGWRNEIEALSVEDGLAWLMNAIAETGLFSAQRSWIEAESPELLLLRYEKLSAKPLDFLTDLFTWLDVGMSEKEIVDLNERHLWSVYRANKPWHYQVGHPGSWKEYFSDGLAQRFRDLTGDLVECLGYEWGVVDEQEV